jgi:hypothetical protein
LKRLANHAAHETRRFALPWNGYVAIIEGSTRGVHKEEARAVERLLLDVAKRTDRLPRVNVSPGATSVVTRFFSDETLRVEVSGYDPLASPREARPLEAWKGITARMARDGEYALDHDWRKRRLRKPL